MGGLIDIGQKRSEQVVYVGDPDLLVTKVWCKDLPDQGDVRCRHAVHFV